jgi:hypothetical protein
MALLDELQNMYGGLLQEEQEDPLEKLLRESQQVEPANSVQPLQAMDMAPAAAASPTDQGLGHPDVLAYVKELEQSGQLTGGGGQKPPDGMRAQQATITGEQGGPNAQQRAEGVAVRGAADLANQGVDRDRLFKMADELEQRAAYLRQDAAVEHEARLAKEQELAEKQARLRAQQMELASQNEEPINPKRAFENMSTFATLSAIISAGIYGYVGGRGQPPVAEMLMQRAQQDVQAQLADRQANAARRSAIIEQYQNQYNDTGLVAKRLEADKLLTLAKESEAKGMEAKTSEVKAAAEDLAAKLKNRVGVLHREIQEATFEKPVNVSTTYARPKPIGGGDPNKQLKEALEMDALLEKRGYSREERAAMLTAAKLPPPSGKTEAELKREDETAKRSELSDSAKQKVAERVDGLAKATQGFQEFDKVAGIKRNSDGEPIAADEKKLDSATPGAVPNLIDATAGAIPFGIGKGLRTYAQDQQPEDVKALRRAADKITSGMAHAESGAGVSEDEMARYAARLPITNEETLKTASAELFREQRQQYRNLVGEYGQAAVDEMLRKRGIDPSVYR